MTEQAPITHEVIGKLYDEQARDYAGFADESFAWRYMERPAFDRYIPDLYRPGTRVLDIGCGTGIVARHLVSRGILPQNIIGIDISDNQLKQARIQTPGVTFVKSAADEFDLPAGSIDLVTTNTVLHHLDNETFARMLEKIYKVLVPGGSYFFVEVNADHSEEGRNPKNTNKWTTVKTPWGTEIPFFNRDPYDLIDILDLHGFDKASGWLLNVVPEGKVEPEKYAYYSSRPSRVAARYKKVSEFKKILRSNDISIPLLVETPDQRTQRELVEQYFKAWQTQSVELVADIFSTDAVYDEKNGVKEPLHGLETIQKYWKTNPLSQKNIQLHSTIVGFSGSNSVWAEFNGNFDMNGQHMVIEGIILFTIDLSSGKITGVKEYSKTEKIPQLQA